MRIKRMMGLSAFLLGTALQAQPLLLKDAVEQGVANYGIIKARSHYARARDLFADATAREYLPNLVFSAQQSYGTINGQNGPAYGFGGFGVASSGLPLPEQSWNAAFGALYLVNINWEFFTFGRTRQRIRLARADAGQYKKDLEQEVFQHRVRIAAAYLNLLAAQRLLVSQQKNLDRAEVFRAIAAEKVKSGLIPGVDEAQATAEVSKAAISLNQLSDLVKERNNYLLELVGGSMRNVITDSALVGRVPVAPVIDSGRVSDNPLATFYRSRISFSDEQQRLFRKEYYPSVSLFGVYQTRASGFTSDYITDRTAFTRDYYTGISPERQNYLLGAGVFWNVTAIPRAGKRAAAQRLISEGLQAEYDQLNQRLTAQSDLADTRLRLALANSTEAPRQVTAAAQAYQQKLTLYNNGLTDLLQVTQAAYILNRAETDRDVVSVNVYQALLLKAAATGNFDLFMNTINP